MRTVLHGARVLLTASAAAWRVRAPADEPPAITWGASVESASGGGQRGPWRQNESKDDYVDEPTVALDAHGAAAVAWVDQRRKDVWFQVYERNGAPRHTPPVNVSRSPAVFSWLPRLVRSPGHPSEVYVLWQELVFSGGSHGGELFFARSRDGGARFSQPINRSNAIGGDGKGRINKDIWPNGSLDLAIGRAGALSAAWTDYDGPLWCSRSNGRGESCSQPLRLAGGGKAEAARAPALAVGPANRVYLAWTVGEADGADIRLASSSDGGRTFGPPTIVAMTTGYADAPKLAVDRKGTVHVVHGESSGGPFDRYHVRSTRSPDGARTFEPGRELSRLHPERIESAAFPALSVDEQDNAYVLWEISPERHEPPRGLALASSRAGGQTFSAPAMVPGSSDPAGGLNGSHQGLLLRKLGVQCAGDIAVVNSRLKPNEKSRVWLMRGHWRQR